MVGVQEYPTGLRPEEGQHQPGKTSATAQVDGDAWNGVYQAGKGQAVGQVGFDGSGADETAIPSLGEDLEQAVSLVFQQRASRPRGITDRRSIPGGSRPGGGAPPPQRLLTRR